MNGAQLQVLELFLKLDRITWFWEDYLEGERTHNPTFISLAPEARASPFTVFMSTFRQRLYCHIHQSSHSWHFIFKYSCLAYPCLLIYFMYFLLCFITLMCFTNKVDIGFLPVVQELAGCSVVSLLFWWADQQLHAAALGFWLLACSGGRLLCQLPTTYLQAAKKVPQRLIGAD